MFRTRTSNNPFNAGADPTLLPTKPRAHLNRKWDQKLKLKKYNFFKFNNSTKQNKSYILQKS